MKRSRMACGHSGRRLHRVWPAAIAVPANIRSVDNFDLFRAGSDLHDIGFVVAVAFDGAGEAIFVEVRDSPSEANGAQVLSSRQMPDSHADASQLESGCVFPGISSPASLPHPPNQMSAESIYKIFRSILNLLEQNSANRDIEESGGFWNENICFGGGFWLSPMRLPFARYRLSPIRSRLHVVAPEVAGGRAIVHRLA